MKNLLYIFNILLLSTSVSYGQYCNITVTPGDTTVCPGDSILIEGAGAISSSQLSFDFNSGTLPAGWSVDGGSNFSQICGPNPSGTNYYWASTTSTGEPNITTPSYDVSCGGTITFDMVYSVQGGTPPCEGPDLQNEGVELQYSLDGGSTWNSIVYYSPGGFELPSNPMTGGSSTTGPTAYTTWSTFNVTIPSGAYSTSTIFRWIQQFSSGSPNDNWGLDNINFQPLPCNDPNVVINWSNGYTDSSSFYITPTVDTFFVAYVYDTLGNYQCESDTLFISINTASLTYDLVDTVEIRCPNDTMTVDILNMANGTTPYTFNWSTGSTTNSSEVWSEDNKHDTLVYYVTITDGCGYIYDDSVVTIVNQILSIDTLMSGPSSACAPTGWVSAVPNSSSYTLDPGHQPYFNWTGPNTIPGSYSINATVMTDLPSGWYYFTLTDDVCSEMDSVFVDIENPPMAVLDANITSGCIPVNVTFTNSSQNTTHYTWDFGNGNIYNVNDQSSQSESFTSSSLVMLIAMDDSNCADTAYVAIDVVPCGCTNPIALNYNPLATIDDGSCILPTPTVIAPNVFTPNGDNENDIYVLNTTNAANIELVIVSRWGNIMYEGNGINPAWDGKTPGGSNADEGTYFYRYKVEGYSGEIIEGHGFLQLIRD